MKQTMTPTFKRCNTGNRGGAHRTHQATRHVAPRAASFGEPRVGDESMRSRVADAFRRMTNAVDAARAEVQTKAFYRSSGRDWAQALTEHPAVVARAQILEAFRTRLRGVHNATAHANMIRFYKSANQDLASTL